MPTVYSPPVSTYVPLATITLASTDSEIVFSSIPATYRDLVLVSSVRQTVNTNHNMRLNGDTGSNYPFVQMFGNGSSPISNSGTLSYFTPFINGNPDATSPVTGITQFLDYSATDKHKTILTRGDMISANGTLTSAAAFRWTNTNAINQITIYSVSGSISIGSSFSLYGIAA